MDPGQTDNLGALDVEVGESGGESHCFSARSFGIAAVAVRLDVGMNDESACRLGGLVEQGRMSYMRKGRLGQEDPTRLSHIVPTWPSEKEPGHSSPS